MKYGIVKNAIASIYEGPYMVKDSESGQVSALADEGLCGMSVAITEKGLSATVSAAGSRFVSVRTFYGYTGYMKTEDLVEVREEEVMNWEATNLMVVSCFCADVLSVPKVQGICLISLYRGALVSVTELESGTEGWAKVRLIDGREGYIRSQYLQKKEFSQAGVWTGEISQNLPQPNMTAEEAFRRRLVYTASAFLGIQYRWGGKSTAGIDCSGLTSMSYMLNGVLTYRDAKIVEGYPVRKISVEQMKKGDLLYFPGHIAMYIGNGKYIHATGKAGSGGVVVNTLNPGDSDYREDLARGLYTVGSIFL